MDEIKHTIHGTCKAQRVLSIDTLFIDVSASRKLVYLINCTVLYNVCPTNSRNLSSSTCVGENDAKLQNIPLPFLSCYRFCRIMIFKQKICKYLSRPSIEMSTWRILVLSIPVCLWW